MELNCEDVLTMTDTLVKLIHSLIAHKNTITHIEVINTRDMKICDKIRADTE